MKPEPIFHAQAPTRLDFAGGWTDVPPFAAREGGLVVNGAIRLYATAEVAVGGRGLHLTAEDLGVQAVLRSPAELDAGGPLALLSCALRRFPVHPCRLTTRCDAPPGSGLGSSGALGVALVAALLRARGEDGDPPELAGQAWEVEAVEAGMAGGGQDQYAAALGGFLRLGFADGAVRHDPIVPDPGFAEELARRTVLCYTGTSRVSGDTITRVMAAYDAGDAAVTGALREMKDIAAAAASALARGDLAGLGSLLTDNWRCQVALDPGMRTPAMAGLEAAVAGAGIWGGKAAGAGAGGCMFFLASGDPARVATAAASAGARVLPVAWSPEGVRTW